MVDQGEQIVRTGPRLDARWIDQGTSKPSSIVRDNPYRDGNKRIGFLAIATCLGINGQDLTATDAEVVGEIVAMADGSVSEEVLAGWIRQHSTKRR
ncbi:MAG: type II toxin-antitoxin system death-on-curing family toxin [Vicinamibacterales bacterium]